MAQATRLLARKRVKSAITACRRVAVVLAELERLDQEDVIGSFVIEPGQGEAQYLSELRSFIAEARSQSEGALELLFLASTPTHSPQGIEKEQSNGTSHQEPAQSGLRRGSEINGALVS